MRRPPRLAGIVALAAAALVARGRSGVAQETPPPPPPVPVEGERPTEQPPPGKPRPPTRSPGTALANKPIEDVELFRGGESAPVTRAGAWFDLDLSGVDFTNDPLLVVDGAPVRRADLERQLCWALGANEIDQFVTGILLERVKREMAAAGQPVPKIEITADDVKRKFDEEMKLRAQMPGGASPEEFERQLRESFGWDRYVDLQRRQMEFERFFLPDPPEEWAKRQAEEARRLDEEQKQRLAEEAKAAAEKAATQGEGAKPPPAPKPPPPAVPPADLSFVPAKTWELLEPGPSKALHDMYARGGALHPFVRSGYLPMLRRKLLESVELRVGRPDEADALVVCDGQKLSQAELSALLARHVDDDARRMALRELVDLRAVERRLAKEGALLSPEAADAEFAEFQKRHAGSIISSERLVTVLGFNSLWHYRAYFRCKRSYEKNVVGKLGDDRLSAYYEKSGRLFFESGACSVRVLFVPGPDKAASRTEIDGLLAQVAQGTPFAQVAREKGRFPEGGEVRGGATPALARAKLRTTLGEDEYTSFLTGYSFADEVFYASREEGILGPVWRDLAPKLTGWLALQVDRCFTTGSKPPFQDAKTRERALDDYADITFPRYVNDALLACRVDLPTPVR
jgi:hypothetical protein